MKSILYTSYLGVPGPNTGGSNKIIYEILKYHDYENYDVDFLSSQFYSHYRSISDLELDESNKLTRVKKFGQYLYTKNKFYKQLVTAPIYQKLFFKKSEKFLKKKAKVKEYDIVHNHDVVTASTLKNFGKKSVLTVHSKGSIVQEILNNSSSNKFTDYLVTLRRKQEIEAVKSAEVITYPSKAAFELHKTDLEALVPDYIWDKVRIIYNGIDLESINAINPDEELIKDNKKYDLSILNIAAHVKEKNIPNIIEAIRILKYEKGKKVRFVNIGEGPLTEHLNKQIGKFNLTSEIKLLGRKPNEEVIRLLKSFDYLLMPSERVVFDMVILEALACGICIVASNNGGNREVLEDGVNAYFLNGYSAVSIVKKLLLAKKNNLCSNPYLRLKSFTSKDMVKKYHYLYDEINKSKWIS